MIAAAMAQKAQKSYEWHI